MQVNEKTCPDCAETIKIAARVCRYCGFRFPEQVELTDADTGPTIEPFAGLAPPTNGTVAAQYEDKRSDKFGVFVFASLFATVAGAITAFAMVAPGTTIAAKQAKAAAAVPSNGTVAPTMPTYTDDQRSMICRAAIAILFGRDPKIMTTQPRARQITRVQYTRTDDNTVWKSDCRIDAGNRIVWRSVDAFGDDGPGRWRDGPYDERLTFTLSGSVVAIEQRYSDGSTTNETYKF